VRESSEHREYVKRIIEVAQNAGVNVEKLETYAINGGATTEELFQVLGNNQ
jgi:predicted secreted Zn-dependent protease